MLLFSRKWKLKTDHSLYKSYYTTSIKCRLTATRVVWSWSLVRLAMLLTFCTGCTSATVVITAGSDASKHTTAVYSLTQHATVTCTSIRFNGHFPGGPGLAGTRMSPFWILLELRMMEVVSGDNWSYKTCKTPVKSSPPTNQRPVLYRPNALPAAQPTVSSVCLSRTSGLSQEQRGLGRPKLAQR